MSRCWGGTFCRAPAPCFQVRFSVLLHLRCSNFILVCRFEHRVDTVERTRKPLNIPGGSTQNIEHEQDLPPGMRPIKLLPHSQLQPNTVLHMPQPQYPHQLQYPPQPQHSPQPHTPAFQVVPPGAPYQHQTQTSPPGTPDQRNKRPKLKPEPTSKDVNRYPKVPGTHGPPLKALPAPGSINKNHPYYPQKPYPVTGKPSDLLPGTFGPSVELLPAPGSIGENHPYYPPKPYTVTGKQPDLLPGTVGPPVELLPVPGSIKTNPPR